MEASVVLRGLQTVLLSLAVGLFFLAHFIGHHLLEKKPAALTWFKRLLALVCILQLLRIANVAWATQALVAPGESILRVLQTYGVKVLLLQAAVLYLALVMAYLKPQRKTAQWFLLFLLHLVMLGMGLSGHVVSASEAWLLSLAAMTHVLLAQLWLSGIFALLLWVHQQHRSWAQAISRFSIGALPGMLLLLITGVYMARWSVGSWPGLLATNYGVLLLLKLVLVVGALWCAMQLRLWLLQPTADLAHPRSWLSIEAGLALGVVSAASFLAATVPASHDTVVWPFAFRWAPVLALRQDTVTTTQSLAIGAALWIGGGLLWAWWRKRMPFRAIGVLFGGVVAGAAVALPGISIPAYPSTYMHSSVRLDAPSVIAGMALYEQHCVACHGVHGHGDGPVAKLNKLQPANLTEPHVSWHTHGDMFWWLSHGKGQMPGFSQVLSEDDRWHLINWLIALSLGYEGRTITGTPAPFNPWLPSIDFRFQMDNNNFMSLSEWRGLHAVHLIIVNHENELQRVRDLLKDMNGFPAQLVVVSRPEWLKYLVKGPCEAILVGDVNGDIARAWSHYRRSFAAPDMLNEELLVPRMEFLIDRYGFVRARWRSDETPNALSLNELKVVFDTLAPEGEIKSAAIHEHD